MICLFVYISMLSLQSEEKKMTEKVCLPLTADNRADK